MIASFFKRKGAESEVDEEQVVSQATAPPADGRVSPSITIAKSLADLPEFQAVLTQQGASVPVSKEDQAKVALLLIERTDQGTTAVTVWTNRIEDHGSLRFMVSRARGLGIMIVGQYEASPDLLEVLHDPSTTRNKEAVPEALSNRPGEAEALLDRIITKAVGHDASDIHIHYNQDGPTSVYLRIDGDLILEGQYRREIGEALSRVSYVQTDDASKLGSTRTEFNSATFQGGTLAREITVDDKLVQVRLRMASKPVHPSGWDVILRVQVEGKAGDFWELSRCGYDQPQRNAFERLLSYPTGLILMVGTTGSGKSRTLQTLMGELNKRNAGRKAMVTIEDPPEYVIPGARQVPVVRGSGDGTGFAEALRECMRADPDVIMIGEIRDPETARAAQQAVLTGHKVLATLHAADVHLAFDRLVDLGVERSVLASPGFIRGVIHQQLVPHACKHCSLGFEALKDQLDPDLVHRINMRAGHAKSRLRFRGPGCEHCEHRSTAGRSAAAEMLVPDMEYLSLFGRGNTTDSLMHWRSLYSSSGIDGRMALDHGIAKMCDGIVSPLDIEAQLGPLDGAITTQEALNWMRRNGGQPELKVVPAGGERS